MTGMATFVANNVIKTMPKRKQSIDITRVLVMGLNCKKSVPDTHNAKIVDLVQTLQDFVGEVAIYDPVADIELAKHEYGIEITNELPRGAFNAAVLAVKHDSIATLGEVGIKALLVPDGPIYDLKGILPRDVSHARI